MSAVTHTVKRKVQLKLRDIKNVAGRAGYKPAALSPEQDIILQELKQNGFVMLPAEKALGKHQWEAYTKAIDSFLQSNTTLQNREAYYAGGKTEGSVADKNFNKTFNIMGTQVYPDFHQTTPLKDFKDNAFLKPIINNYYGQPTKAIYADYWYTLKTHNPGKDVYSQAWHCDPEGDRIIKIFIYFNDVNERNGALQYIKGTQRGGKNSGPLKNIARHTSHYPTEEFVKEYFPQEDIVYATAPKGTIVICDTRGLHRGGKCLDGERIMGVLEFMDNGSMAHEVI